MAQNKILIDSSAYLQLARQHHPLLGVEFGKENNCLYIIDDLKRELNATSRLQLPFAWLNEHEYRHNRVKTVQVSREDYQQVSTSLEAIRERARTERLPIVAVDAEILAHGQVLGLPVVSGDPNVRALAENLKIVVWTVEKLQLTAR